MIEKMSKTTFTILLIVLYVGLYAIFKTFIVLTQDLYMDKKVYEKQYNIGKVMNIHQSKIKEEDYFVVESDKYKVKVKNVFDGFEQTEQRENETAYALFGEDNKVIASFEVGKYDSQMVKIEDTSEDGYYYELNRFPLYTSDFFRKYYFKKYNITNDVDLVRHVRERKKIKCNFLTPITKIQENYFFNLIEIALPNLDNITYLDGDRIGYMIEEKNIKRAFIVENDELYYLAFYKLDYYTDDKINEIINSLVIEK